MSLQTGDTERRKHHCLARINGTHTISDCKSTKNYYCVGGKYSKT